MFDAAFFRESIANPIKAGLLTYSIPYAFPVLSSGTLYRTVLLELTVARQSVIFTRFPFHSVYKRNTLTVEICKELSDCKSIQNLNKENYI